MVLASLASSSPTNLLGSICETSAPAIRATKTTRSHLQRSHSGLYNTCRRSPILALWKVQISKTLTVMGGWTSYSHRRVRLDSTNALMRVDGQNSERFHLGRQSTRATPNCATLTLPEMELPIL